MRVRPQMSLCVCGRESHVGRSPDAANCGRGAAIAPRAADMLTLLDHDLLRSLLVVSAFLVEALLEGYRGTRRKIVLAT